MGRCQLHDVWMRRKHGPSTPPIGPKRLNSLFLTEKTDHAYLVLVYFLGPKALNKAVEAK